MSRLMYDSIDPFAIPAEAAMVAGYVDGSFRWTDAGWARFPNAVKVRVSCLGSNNGHVIDVEQGCVSPQFVPTWVRGRLAAGVRPSVYVNRSNRTQVHDILVAAGLLDTIGGWWVSTLDGTIVADAIATQYCGAQSSGDPCTSAGNYDLSAVADFWPGIDTVHKGGNMGPYVHPSIANRRDYCYVNPDRTVTHAWWDGVNGYTENLGGSAVPGFVGGAWISDTILALTHVSAVDGQLHEIALPINGGSHAWYPVYGKAALGIPGPAGSTGPAGPAGPATYIPHHHKDDGGTPV